VKGDHLGEFEELLILALQALRDEGHVVQIQQYLERITTRNVSLGAVYAGLDRLEVKGLVRSTFGEPTNERGGKRKRIFSVTTEGKRKVQAIRRVRDAMWDVIRESR
jgi:DNA-binding PadR family transcriptional regulator